ncbi:hypothetical protein NliqN6_4064 [Naganishia liquefaciens]|uniref:Magnesium-dependent phosphatase-1 n=1 Tax=Naganishia liquefaciens TaxID=104408 RepID=A0A8H3TV05_9TREE|nr:hypothetical protein NliqN6_4064 [Naganishia liquefaciens]
MSPSALSSSESAGHMPKLVCFDLDYTLWDLWIDTHITPPIRRKGDAVNSLQDRHGTELGFYAQVPEILSELKRRDIHVAAASRTHAPDLAREALGLLLVPGQGKDDLVKAVTFFQTMEIYPGSKLRHFKSIHKKTGIAYSEMLFFDDEARNKEVESLGVTMCLVRNGVDRKVFERGLAEWRKRNGK